MPSRLSIGVQACLVIDTTATAERRPEATRAYGPRASAASSATRSSKPLRKTSSCAPAAEALLIRLRLDLREAFAFASRALIDPPTLSGPAGALMPALDETIAVALANPRRAER